MSCTLGTCVMDSSFYVYLTSDSNAVLHHKNKAHHFRVTLNHEVLLPEEEEWEVGLVEMTYTNIIPLFTNNESFMLYARIPKPPKYGVFKEWTFKPKEEAYPTSIWEEFESQEKAQAFIDEQWNKRQRRVQDLYWHVPNEFTIAYDVVRNRFTFTTEDPSNRRRINLAYFYQVQMGFKATTPVNELNKVGHYYLPVVDKHIYGETYIAPYPPTSDVIRFNNPQLPLEAWKVHVDGWHEIEYVDVKMPVGHFDSVDSVLDMINQKTKEAIDLKSTLKNHYKDMNLFNHNQATSRIQVNLPPRCHIIFRKGMEAILGFNETTYDRTTMAENTPKMRAQTYSLLVYCNIIEPQYVNNLKLQLLRTLPLRSTKVGEDIIIPFENVYYFPLVTSTLNSIEVVLYSDSAESLVQIEGKTVLLLHFRRCNYK